MKLEFHQMRDKLIEHFNQNMGDATHLFSVLVDKDAFYNLYLDSFPAGSNEIYRERRWHDCSCCRGFIKNMGNVVAIKDGKVITLWDCELGDEVYQVVFDKMNEYLMDVIAAQGIEDVYLSVERAHGCHHNTELIEKTKTQQWDHFFLELPDKFVLRNGRSKGDVIGEFRDTRNVFKRSLDEITLDALDTVIELIAQGSLYKGDEWKSQLNDFRKYKKAYEKLNEFDRGLYAWEQGVKVGPVIGRIRNHSIGTLLTNLSEGMDLETAVKKYEDITAPSSYKRSKPIFTQKMLEDAQKKITELGYLDSLPRRYARQDDITVNDILFCNKDASKRITGAADVFGELAKQAKGSKAQKFDRVEEIGYEKFLSDVLPTASEVELYLENKHTGNMVSLIAPQNPESKSMFKWGNNFGWAYSGNMTDSMKERVKEFGGKVDGVLRFSISWNSTGTDNSDLDAHCIEPDRNEIYFGRCRKPAVSKLSGQLDVDITHPQSQCRDGIAVENITWSNKAKMIPGVYKFFVNQFEARGTNDGFTAEIEFDGQIYSFEYPHSVHGNVQVAEVMLDEKGNFSIKELLPSSMSSKTVWNVKTNEFVPVSVICMSPNHWETADNKTGHKHVFFMLKDCINDESPAGFFNEYLVQELYENRKVMEALGSKLRVEDTDDQLSGVGFATDKRAEVVVKVKGATERVLKIKF